MTMLESEIWKPLALQPGFSVSNTGRMKSADGRIKAMSRPNDRYPDYVFTKKNGKSRHIDVHVAVCTAFHGPKPFPDAVVLHLNDNYGPERYHAHSVRWGSPAENQAEKASNGRARRRWSDTQYLDVYHCHQGGESKRSLARRYDASQSTIQDLLKSARLMKLLAAHDKQGVTCTQTILSNSLPTISSPPLQSDGIEMPNAAPASP